MTIFSSKLTTCSVSDDGEVVELRLIDRSGNALSLQLPFDQAESVVMTLPRLLGWALKRRTRSEKSRYVFHLGKWSIDGAEDSDCLLLTLMTIDGFEVTFAVPFATGESLGTSLRDNVIEQAQSAEGPLKGVASHRKAKLS